jgi:gliding motility-associated-like protein
MKKNILFCFVLLQHFAFSQCDIDLQATFQTNPNTKCAGFSQFCDYSGPSILINEINISPSQFNGNMFGQFNTTAMGEWIELFNPNWCDSVDISGYYFGSYNSNGAGTPASFGMGFVFPQNTIVPPLGFVIVRGVNAPVPPVGVIDIIVNDADNRICIDGGLTTSRFWFQDLGSWFAFYDNNGVPQDAITWGSPIESDLDFRPCIPINNPNPNVTFLPAYNEIGTGVVLGSSSVGLTFVRIPDGGDWSPIMVSEFTSYGSCNVIGGCNTLIGASSSCNGIAEVTMQNGQAPFTFQWNDVLNQKTQTADSLCGGTYSVVITDANNCTTTLSIEIVDDFLDVNMNIVNPSCNGDLGNIQVNTNPSEGNFYVWSANTSITDSITTFANNLQIGVYDLTIINEDCIIDTTIILGSPQPITDLIFTIENETCDLNNGVVTITQTVGGLPSYEYNFNGQGFGANSSFNNVNQGTYIVEVKDVNDCFYSEEITLININGPTDFDYLTSNTTCGNPNGSIFISNIQGGTPQFQYSIDGQNFSNLDLISGLSSGTYTVTIRDENGCLYNENNIIITNIAGPTDFDYNFVQPICTALNGSIEITNIQGGTSPYLYNFNETNFSNQTLYSNLSGAIYNVEIQDANGCLYSDTIHLLTTFNPSPTGFEYNFTQPICTSINGSIEITNVVGGTNPYLYNFNTTSFNTTTLYSNLDDGIYNVSIQDANGCLFEDTIQLLPDFSSSPTDLVFNILDPNCGLENGKIVIDDVIGGTANYLYQINQSTPSLTNEFSNLGLGVYLIKVTDAFGCVYEENIPIVKVIGEEKIRIPNIFTPSNDKVNDIWNISGECLTDITCTIINRWGNFINELKNINEFWDGTTIKGEFVKEGVYFYILNATFASGREEQFHGNISVVYE